MTRDFTSECAEDPSLAVYILSEEIESLREEIKYLEEVLAEAKQALRGATRQDPCWRSHAIVALYKCETVGV